MKNIFFQILIFFIFLSIVSNEKNQKSKNKQEKSKSKSEKKPKSSHKSSKKIDEIESIMNWAKKNNIYINPNLKLNKNNDNNHNFYYFTSTTDIPYNTTLLKVPQSIMISQSSLDNHFKSTKNKFSNLWEKILKVKNLFISTYSTKQLFYIGILIENAINKKKGSFYKKYKPYFNMYEYMNLDNFPVFYDLNEIYYLSTSNFGSELDKSIKSLKEEYYIINNDLNISNSIQDSFFKYRVLALANSLNRNNQSFIIPFIDCFSKVVTSNKANANYTFNNVTNNDELYFEIKSIRYIKANDEIVLKWRKFSNNDCLTFYGFIEKENSIPPKIYISLFNSAFKKDLGIPMNKTYKGVIATEEFELRTELFEEFILGSYKNLSRLFDKYKNKKEGMFEMMADNLAYYLEIYKVQYTEGKINLYINGEKKRDNIKHIMKMEEKLISDKLEYVKNVIKDIKENKIKDL